MTRGASARALRALNRVFHVALPLIFALLLTELPLVDRWSGDPAVLGTVAALVTLVAAIGCLAALRRQSGPLGLPMVLLGTGMGAVAATYAFGAAMVLNAARPDLGPHPSVGRLAMAFLLVVAAVALRLSAGPDRAPRWTARQRLVGIVAAFTGVELALIAAVAVGALAGQSGTLLGVPIEMAVRLGDLAAMGLFLVASAILVAPTGAVTRRDSLLATGAALLSIAALVATLGGEGVQPVVAELAVIAGLATCVAGIRARDLEDTSQMLEGIRTLAAQLADGVFLFDRDRRLAWHNEAGGRLLAIDGTALGTTPEQLFGAGVGLRYAVGEARVRTPDGSTWHVIVARDLGGEIEARTEAARLGDRLTAALEQIRDLERVVEIQQADLDRATTLDPATGVANRRAILGRLRTEVAQARRYPHPVGAVILEVDAPDAPDQIGVALREVALRLRLRARESDGIGRSGAQQFLLVLPHTDERGIAALTRSLRRSIVDEPITGPAGPFRVVIALGSAVFRSGAEISVDELLTRAETELSASRGPANASDSAEGPEPSA